MGLRRSTLGFLGVATVAFVATLPAAGKDGVKATLTTRIPLNAPAGTNLHVAWTLGYVGEHGLWHAFGGGGIFVRLVSPSGVTADTAFAQGKPGRYAANVRVPKDGIGRVQIGIRGWMSGRPGDALFPITNDPTPR
jgi:hypothetical protein